MENNIKLTDNDYNIQLYPAAYEDDLKEHFAWADAVFNPGHTGLLVMNAARFGRPIFIDRNSRHAPEIQLAKDAEQDFIDFGDSQEVDELVERCLNNKEMLIEKGKKLATVMAENYTIEYMAQQYLKAIEGKWW